MNKPQKIYKTSLFIVALIVALFLVAPAAQASSLSVNWLMAGNWEGSNGGLAHQAAQQSRANTTTADGRLAVFWSEAGNTVAGDTNNASDIFMFDRITKVTQRINIGAGGTQGNGHTRSTTISADGRYIGFTTAATNTVVGPQCIPAYDCTFAGVLDRTTGAITVANKDSSGQLLPVTNGNRPTTTTHVAMISGDGKWFLFSSPSPIDRGLDIFVRNLTTGAVKQANVDNQNRRNQFGATEPSISHDGRYVAFTAESYVLPEDANGTRDVYVRDMQQNKTRLASHAFNAPDAGNSASDAGNISGNGQLVVFKSHATNLLAGGNPAGGNIFLYNMQNNTTKQITTGKYGGHPNGQSFNPSITADGSHITFISEASNLVRTDVQHAYDLDIFLYYGNAGITRMIKLPARTDVEMFLLGVPAINADGKAITYQLYTRSATNPAANAYYIYLNYDAVSHIPFYDPEDILDLLP